jgi:peroxiredoxin
MTEPLPDERPQRRREYSGAASTLGVAALIVLAVGISIWFFEFRTGGSAGGHGADGYGIIDLPAGANTTGKSPAAEIGRAAPNFKLASIDGTATTLDAFRGKYVLVNFWANWCSPCRKEAPDLEALSATATNGLVVLGVNQQEDRNTASSFADEFNVTYPLVLDTDGDVSQAYRVGHGLPNSFLVDPNGVVTRIYYGALSQDELAKLQAAEPS